MRILWLVLFVSACADRFEPGEPDPGPGPLDSLDGLPGEPCGTNQMVVVTRADDTTFCIDRLEASLGPTAAAQVVLGVVPATGVTWQQATNACDNAGKRLCTVEEWERACRGPEGRVYPYGDTIDDTLCRGFFNYPENKPEVTGSIETCGSYFGAYDLSGNVEEWTSTAVERIPGSGIFNDKAIRGGSFKSNSNALQCVGAEFHAAPESSDIDRGFRCCMDGP